jgi:PAS domain S-box-containing protein
MSFDAMAADRDLLGRYLDLAPVLIVVVAADNRVQYANQHAAELLGWTPEEMIGKDWFALAVPEDVREERRRGFEALVASRGPIPSGLDAVVVARDGTSRIVQWHVTMIGGADGATVASLCSGREVTEQRRAEGEIAQQKARFEVLADASRAFAEVGLDYGRLLNVIAERVAATIGDGATVSLLTEDGESIRSMAFAGHDPELAQAYRAMLAQPARRGEGMAGRAIATNASVLLAEVDPEQLALATASEWRDVVRRLNVHSLLVVPMRVRGAPIGSFSLFRNRPGHPYGPADEALVQDLADRAGLAVENARLHAGLERRVRERTAELEDTLGELESFSYSVSHDLRSPLRSIDGFSQAVLDDCADQLDEVGKSHLARVRAAARHMGLLIDALLNLSRVGRAELHRERVDVTALGRSVFARLREEHPRTGIECVVADGLVADADPKLLDLVLMNLLGNSWKFTGRQERARIELAQTPATGDGPAVFAVRDDGAGFETSRSDKLFGVFQRLHPAGEFEGTGIGLATVQRIVRRHGGRVWAEGAVGQGATFFFTLAPDARS